MIDIAQSPEFLLKVIEEAEYRLGDSWTPHEVRHKATRDLLGLQVPRLSAVDVTADVQALVVVAPLTPAEKLVFDNKFEDKF